MNKQVKKRFKLGIFALMIISLVGYTLGMLQVELEGYLNGIIDTILLGLLYKYVIKEED